ncbi:hypothetical protein BJX64DRAFT_257844 [Aspergillus heterothallicus]
MRVWLISSHGRTSIRGLSNCAVGRISCFAEFSSREALSLTLWAFLIFSSPVLHSTLGAARFCMARGLLVEGPVYIARQKGVDRH